MEEIKTRGQMLDEAAIIAARLLGKWHKVVAGTDRFDGKYAVATTDSNGNIIAFDTQFYWPSELLAHLAGMEAAVDLLLQQKTPSKREQHRAAESWANYTNPREKEIAVKSFMAGCDWLAKQRDND